MQADDGRKECDRPWSNRKNLDRGSVILEEDPAVSLLSGGAAQIGLVGKEGSLGEDRRGLRVVIVRKELTKPGGQVVEVGGVGVRGTGLKSRVSPGGSIFGVGVGEICKWNWLGTLV